jgi:signal transduction histidine kinase
VLGQHARLFLPVGPEKLNRLKNQTIWEMSERLGGSESMPERAKLLIVSAQEGLCAALRNALAEQVTPTVVDCAPRAKAAIELMSPQIVVIDLALPAQSGEELSVWLTCSHAHIETILLTDEATTSAAERAIRMGAHDYLVVPWAADWMVEVAVKRALTRLEKAARLRETIGQLRKSEQSFASIIERATDAVLVLDPNDKVLFANPAAIRLLANFIEQASLPFTLNQPLERVKISVDGHDRSFDVRVSESEWQGFPAQLVAMRDVSDRVQMELQLRQAQKLESIGQLAAGIAHEINTPIQYIGDNASFLQQGFGLMLGLLEEVERFVESDEAPRSMLAALERAKPRFMRKQVPRAADQILEGVDRVSSIVSAMKEFSHPSQGCRESTDLKRTIDSTVMVARNEWKYVAELEVEHDEAIETIPVFRNELNQALLNMLVNAAHAISDTVDGGANGKGKINIRTKREPPWAIIEIEDTGAGIPEEIRGRIFDPFFTTKEVGKGTGQGLAICYSVIVKKHKGELLVKSEVGVGSTFVIKLPLEADDSVEAVA